MLLQNNADAAAVTRAAALLAGTTTARGRRLLDLIDGITIRASAHRPVTPVVKRG
ncbi:hypothetical protein ACFWC9_27500 [Streptomyces goshikiensis]|uniref:hypothetical protein n=1 Tax=Streptomyces goshikiensis TaxID=1942 RepID=UPI0036A151BE